VTLCAFAAARPLFEGDGDRATLEPDFEAEAYFGAGWSAAHGTTDRRYRLFLRRATLLLPLDEEYRYRIGFDLADDRGGKGRVEFTIGDQRVGACDADGRSPCELALEPAVLRSGVTPLTLTSAGGIEFRRARIVREPARDDPAPR
jgi:hypothetical protein